MKIEKLRCCHVENPLGFEMERPVFSWIVSESSGKKQKSARVLVALDENMSSIVFDSGEREDISSLAFEADIALSPRTRYYWQVCVTADNGDTGVSEIAWFETGKRGEPWHAKWIKAPFEAHPLMIKDFSADKSVLSARLYICGLGLYEASLNGEKIGDEYLAPGYDSYQFQIQYQSYDVTKLITDGENRLSVILGKGWYCGRYGFGDKIDKIYGDDMQLLCELHIEYDDGEERLIASDESWSCAPSSTVESNIYDGESIDARIGDALSFVQVEPADAPVGKLIERIGAPVKTLEKFSYELLHTPSGELVLDFKQNMAGFVSFNCSLESGRQVKLQYGELLQNNCFYRDNLRTAEAAFSYISNGVWAHVRPHFTYYGFRYVKVEGMSEEEIEAAGFTAEAIWSELESTGELITSDAKINRLIKNALWSQRGNFVDIPTDCPQRDERMGWTGDAQAFSETASYNMYTPVFYRKYLSDMLYEQNEIGGSVPFVVPDALALRVKKSGKPAMSETTQYDGSCVWGDAATVIPWNLYRYYGDKALLSENYANMKRWVDFIRHEDDTKCGGSHIWSSGFHFADWLSLDNPDKSSCLGGTDTAYVATCYYYFSTSITAKAAEVLGKYDDARLYQGLADEIKSAFRAKYINPDGSLTINTQTAHVLALNWDLALPDKRDVVVDGLVKLLHDNDEKLTTGFVGTYQLCPTLSKCGHTGLAYKLLFNEEFPGWLYEINLGATTIWERWNSVLPDGSVSGTGMNSMNHYCYGSIVQWIYQTVTGLKPDDSVPGFKKAVIAPEPTDKLEYASCVYDSAAGRYEVRWERHDGEITYSVTVPFDAEALFILPDGETHNLRAGSYTFISR